MHLAQVQQLFWKAARREASESEVASCFQAGPRQSAFACMEVYAGAFFARQLDALVTFLPKTARALGPDFIAVAREYIIEHPGEHPALETMPRHFAEYLERHHYPIELVHLARLELTRNGVLLSPPDQPVLSLAELQALGPNGRLRIQGSASLTSACSQALVAFDETLLTRANENGCTQRRDEHGVLFFRKGFAVHHRLVESDEAEALRVLARGASLNDLCAAFLEHTDPALRAHEVLSSFLRNEILAPK